MRNNIYINKINLGHYFISGKKSFNTIMVYAYLTNNELLFLPAHVNRILVARFELVLDANINFSFEISIVT